MLDAVAGFAAPYATVVLAATGMSGLVLAGLRLVEARDYRTRTMILFAPLAGSLLLALAVSPSCFAHWLQMGAADAVHLICSDPGYAYIRSICGSWVTLTSASLVAAGAVVALGYFLGGPVLRAAYGYRRASPEELGDLCAGIAEMCGAAGMGVPIVYLSESGRPTVFSHGGRGEPGVYLSVGLLESLSRDEVLASVGHELAHIRNRDTLWLSAASGLKVASAFNVAGFLLEPALARDREYLADAEGARLSGCPYALASALVKLAAAAGGGAGEAMLGGLFMGLFAPGAGGRGLLSRHPPLSERVKRLLEPV